MEKQKSNPCLNLCHSSRHERKTHTHAVDDMLVNSSLLPGCDGRQQDRVCGDVHYGSRYLTFMLSFPSSFFLPLSPPILHPHLSMYGYTHTHFLSLVTVLLFFLCSLFISSPERSQTVPCVTAKLMCSYMNNLLQK